MQSTPHGAPASAASDSSFVRFGAEPAAGRWPLRQQWQLLSGSPAPFADARHAARDRPRFALVQRGTEGEIWALNERALSEGRQAVADGQRGPLRFRPPHVYTYVDPARGVVMQPLMFVKVSARRDHLDEVLAELRTREARMQEVELQRSRVIVRAQAPLEALLGCGEAVLARTGRSAQVFTWLVRYEAARGTSLAAGRE